MKNQKGFAPLIIILIVVLVGGGTFAVVNRNILKSYFEKGDKPIEVQQTGLKDTFQNGDIPTGEDSKSNERPTGGQFNTLIDSSIVIKKSSCTDGEFSKNITQGLPSDLEPIVNRIMICNHWSEESGYGGPERQVQVEQGIEADQCYTIENDKLNLLNKYPGNEKIKKALESADSWTEGSCQ